MTDSAGHDIADPAPGAQSASGDPVAADAPGAGGLAHAAALSAQEARAALEDIAAAESRHRLAIIEREEAARAATDMLLALAGGRAPVGGVRARIAAFVDRHRAAPGPERMLRASGLFAAAWYARQHGAALGGAAPIDHYLAHGLAANLAPNPFFDPAWYLARNRDAAASGAPALIHYIDAGARQLLAPGPLFSAIAYDARNPDVKRAPDLLAHFLTKGMFEGRAAIPERVPYPD